MVINFLLTSEVLLKNYDITSLLNNSGNLANLLLQYAQVCHLIPGFTLSAETFVKLYSWIVMKDNIEFHEAGIIILLNQYYPELKYQESIKFVKNVSVHGVKQKGHYRSANAEHVMAFLLYPVK